MKTPWTPCPDCDGYWCNIHQAHTHDCDCPEIDEWESSPYQPPTPPETGARLKGKDVISVVLDE